MTFVARFSLLVTGQALLSILMSRRAMSGRDEFVRMSPRRGTLVAGRTVVGLATGRSLDRRTRPLECECSRNK